jgi:hypothetical protein
MMVNSCLLLGVEEQRYNQKIANSLREFEQSKAEKNHNHLSSSSGVHLAYLHFPLSPPWLGLDSGVLTQPWFKEAGFDHQ